MLTAADSLLTRGAPPLHGHGLKQSADRQGEIDGEGVLNVEEMSGLMMVLKPDFRNLKPVGSGGQIRQDIYPLIVRLGGELHPRYVVHGNDLGASDDPIGRVKDQAIDIAVG